MSSRPICVDHLTLPVADLRRSVRFYRAALVDGLGWKEDVVDGRPTFGPEGSEDVSLDETHQPIGAVHLAFSAGSREAVQAFHAQGVASGGVDNGGPGLRPRYAPDYYAAFVRDPDGHNVEAVLHGPAHEPEVARASPDAAVEEGVRRYEQAWRTEGTELLAGLFTADATYSPAPFSDPLTGLRAIERFWSDGRDGPHQPYPRAPLPAAAAGGRSVVRVRVQYEDPRRDYRDLWIIELDPDGRCTAFEEWPFHPASTRVAPTDG
jgi:catechol 2,3-dioxygenase-like lactoylglutathione lyase family enzyme